MTPGQDMRRSRLLVVQPDPLGGLDRFERWLGETTLDVRVIRPFAGEPLPNALDEDGLIVLGGSMNATEDHRHPWLADIRRLLRQAADLVRPTLGICLGGQLLAQALGGTVTNGPSGIEAGVVSVHWRPDARTDPLFADLPTPFLAGAMHGDAVATLPTSSVWLGYTDMYPHQAFRAGPCAWGLQFHPEVSLAGYRHWVETYGEVEPATLAKLRLGLLDFQRLDKQVIADTRILARRFADLVHVYSGQRR